MTTPDEKAWRDRMRKRFETYGPRQNTESAFDYGVVSACADPHPSVVALVEAARNYLNLDAEYRAPRQDGEWKAFYYYWLAEIPKRKEILEKALEAWEKRECCS